MGNNSVKERHGSSGPTVDTYETPPTSPYSLVSTWSPTSQLVSISNCTSTATPEVAQDALSPPLVSTIQSDSLSDSKTGPAKEAEEVHKITQAPSLASHPSDVCVNEDTEVDAKLLQECLNTMQLNNAEESTHTLNDLLQSFLLERKKIKEELRSCKEKIQAEREEWQQFQADLKVALVVSDRLRAESDEELSSLRAAMQDMGTQLADALQSRQEVEGQLESIRVELEQSKQKLKQVTGSHQGALALKGLERQVKGYGMSTGPDEHLWTDEMKGKKEMRISGTTETSRSKLPSSYPDVVVNGTSQPSVAMATESTPQSKTVRLEQQDNMASSIKDKKVENSNPQTCNSSCLDVTNKINRTRTQEDFPSGLRSLRLHGSSRRNSLLRWCQSRTQGYKNIEITNFSSCWVDGLAFCAIYHSYLPSHIPFDKLSPENKKENLTLAFQTGEGFGISTSLTVEEMLKDDAPDWHRVLEYVESIYKHFEM